jgi:predicted small lipoprotein YifL
MFTRSGARLGLIALLGLALALSGCGNSKKGNSYLPPIHHAPSSGRTLSSA